MVRCWLVVAALAALPWSTAWGQGAGQVSPEIYQGWRQYSVHCARCHGQDALGNLVTANLLERAAPGGPVAEEEPFTSVVMAGRPERGMPGFADQIGLQQAAAIYAYVRGRAAGDVPAGRPRPREG